MLTTKQAKELKYREVIVDKWGKRWYVNGKIRTWKTNPGRFVIPLKHGLYLYSSLSDKDFDKDGNCDYYTKEKE